MKTLSDGQIEIVEDHFGHSVSEMQQFLTLYSANMENKLHGENILKGIINEIGLRNYMKQVSGIYLKKNGKVIGGFLVRELEGQYSLLFIAFDNSPEIGNNNMYFFLLQYIMKISIKKGYKVLNAELDENLYGHTLSAGVASFKSRVGFKPKLVDQKINPDIGKELMKITNFDNFMMPVFFYNFGQGNKIESTLIVNESTKSKVNDFKGITDKLNIYEINNGQIVPFGASNSPLTKGGIDFNPNNFNIETQGKGIDYNAPIDPQLLESLTSSPIEGFSPVIFNITPILNLPQILGLNDQDNKPLQQSKVPVEEIYIHKYWQEELEIIV